jgi:hypothetical protein
MWSTHLNGAETWAARAIESFRSESGAIARPPAVRSAPGRAAAGHGDDVLWRGVLERDSSLDGVIFYGVRSTRIYCRPSCPSRRPRRENAVFFRTPSDAEHAGFRPCRRCEPRMFAEWRRVRRLDEELRIAAELQHRLLPAAPPRICGWEIEGVSIPCREVGGDYFDYIPRDAGRLGVALGDASGKGVGAALLVSQAHAAIRSQPEGASPAEILAEVNRYVSASSAPESFLTLFFAELDLATGRLTFSNAGHVPPVLLSADGAVHRLDTPGLPIGVSAERTHAQSAMRIGHGETLLIFSDGLTDVAGDCEELFGEERIITLAARASAAGPRGLLAAMLEAAAEFSGGEAAADDVTIVAVRRGNCSREGA